VVFGKMWPTPPGRGVARGKIKGKGESSMLTAGLTDRFWHERCFTRRWQGEYRRARHGMLSAG